MRIRKLGTDERGIAFPMAMIVMAILSALMAAFAVLATSEPQIAGNHMASTQARSLAESGLERALWALSSGALTVDNNGNLTGVNAPYDNSTLVSVSSVGGFKVLVENGAAPNEKIVTARGYVPNDTNPIAVKKITAVVMQMKWVDPVCGLCAGGENPPTSTTDVRIGGSATVNAAGGLCSGQHDLMAGVASGGTVSENGTPSISTAPGVPATMNSASFPSGMIISDADMATLKARAKANGTYYQGSQTWTSPPANGLIFVDTPSGNPLCGAAGSPSPSCTGASPESDMINVDLHGNWSAGWKGWMVVAGSIQISGSINMTGLIYAQNDVSLHGNGGGQINGAVVSTNRVDQTSTRISSSSCGNNCDTDDVGNTPIAYSCPAVRNGGGSLNNWWVKPGTYKEVSGS